MSSRQVACCSLAQTAWTPLGEIFPICYIYRSLYIFLPRKRLILTHARRPLTVLAAFACAPRPTSVRSATLRLPHARRILPTEQEVPTPVPGPLLANTHNNRQPHFVHSCGRATPRPA